MNEQTTIIALNPGSTSTKVAWFRDEEEVLREIFYHRPEWLSQYGDVWSQFDSRLRLVHEWLQQIKDKPSAIVGIGGLLKPVPSGTYEVNQKMLNDARDNLQGSHASNLGCAMAFEAARRYICPAYVVDPVSVDEFSTLARYSGHPLIQRKSLSHALNIHAVARRAAREIRKEYEKASFVIAHLGGAYQSRLFCVVESLMQMMHQATDHFYLKGRGDCRFNSSLLSAILGTIVKQRYVCL